MVRTLWPEVRPLEREPAKDRVLDDLSLKRGRNEEESEARTSNKKGRGESMEVEGTTTSAASAPMESDESIADELVNALVEEVVPAKADDEEESDLELDFDDTWSMQGMWSSRSDVYSPAHDADDERSREENLAALEKSTKQVLDEVCDKLHSWRPYNSSTDTSPRSPRDVASRASEREPLIIEEDEMMPDLNLVEGSSPTSGTLSKR